jgi:hypothetical protein
VYVDSQSCIHSIVKSKSQILNLYNETGITGLTDKQTMHVPYTHTHTHTHIHTTYQVASIMVLVII